MENRLEKFKAIRFPDTRGIYKEVEKLEAWYANTLMRHRDTVVPVVDSAFPTSQNKQSLPVLERKRYG
jgi:hypothetical protein